MRGRKTLSKSKAASIPSEKLAEEMKKKQKKVGIFVKNSEKV